MMVMKRMKGVSALAMASMLAARAEAATSPFSAARFALNAADGSSRLSDSFSPTEGIAAIQPDKRVKVEPNEIIRLQFTLPLKTAGGQGFSVESSSEYVYEENGQLKKNESFSSHAVKEQNGLPEQIFVQLVHTENDGRRRPVSFLPQVNKQNGKVTWSQRVDRLPLSTLTTQNPTYTLRLLISSAARDAAKPFSLDLGQLFIPHLAIEAGSPTGPMSQRESEARELGFYPWEERRHTFRKEVTEGMPGATKSLVVLAVLVTVPWIILAGLLAPLIPTLTFNSKPRASVSMLIASLLFLETIAYRYYRGDFNLFKMLPYFLGGSAMATVSVIAGALNGVGLKGGC